MTALLGYIPFLHPVVFVHDWWYLMLVPLAFGVSVIYKAYHLESLHAFWREVAIMTVQVVLAMVGLAVGLVILVQVIIPMLPVRPG